MQSILWLLYTVLFSWIRKVTLYMVSPCTSCINYLLQCKAREKTYSANLNEFKQKLPKTQYLIQIFPHNTQEGRKTKKRT